MLSSHGIVLQDSWLISCEIPQGLLQIPMTFFLANKTLRVAMVVNARTAQEVVLEGEVLCKEHAADCLAWTVNTGAVALTFFDTTRDGQSMTGQVRIGDGTYKWSAKKASS